MPMVILIMTDGMRPDALPKTRTPHLDRLQSRSTFTLRARSVMPSLTLPCHMSIFHSVPPQRHGIFINQWQPMARPLPGLMEQARALGRRCYFFHNWEPLRDLNRPESLSYSYYRDNCYTPDGDLAIGEEAARTIRRDRPDFAFVYFGTIDVAGHNFGWMSDKYLAQIERVDEAVGMVLEAMSTDDSVLIQSDHGGHERIHGTDRPEDMTIPWMVAGPDIHEGHEIQSPVTLLDTAPTLARILNIPAHDGWEGRCVEEVFIHPNPE